MMAMRILALAAALLAIAPPGLALLGPPSFSATPLLLDPNDRANVRLGELTYLGGWVLESGDRRFGGISSMTVQGDRLAAISDTGIVFLLRPTAGGIALDAITPLPTGPGGASLSKAGRDSESSAYDPATRRTWVGFETANQIWRYAPGFAAGEASAAPPSLRDLPENKGIETLVRLRDGRFLAIEEDADVPPNKGARARLFAGDPTAPDVTLTRFFYRPPEGFATTDGVELPSGRILLLHRAFSLSEGVRAAFTVFDPRHIQEQALIKGREIARLTPPLSVDNMEALAVTIEKGRPVLWVASDDNFNPVQRTLLMRFAFDPNL